MENHHVSKDSVSKPELPPVNWINVIFLIFVPLIGIIAAFNTPLQPKTAVFALICYFLSEFGVTAGYHRLWAHRSYNAPLFFRAFLMLLGSSAVQGSVKQWAQQHRAHHRFTDTDDDPYSVHRGLWHAHFGWMMRKVRPISSNIDISDLKKDPVLAFQVRNHILLTLGTAYFFPAVVAHVGWNDLAGGIVYAGILRVFAVQQSTFCVNSLAHYLGEQPYNRDKSPKDHTITALLTFGEGYHNYHHTFPSDFRSAIRWWQFDPTKWLLMLCSKLGLVTSLKRFEQDEISKRVVQVEHERLASAARDLHWGPNLHELPVISYTEYQERCAKGEKLLVVAGVAYDVSSFLSEHPGGSSLIATRIGKDATSAFHGGIYSHSRVAHNILDTLRIARIEGGMELAVEPSPASCKLG